METVLTIMDRWPSDAAMAEDAEVSAALIRLWRSRRNIPPKRWPSLIEGARRRGIEGVSADSLFEANQTGTRNGKARDADRR